MLKDIAHGTLTETCYAVAEFLGALMRPGIAVSVEWYSRSGGPRIYRIAYRRAYTVEMKTLASDPLDAIRGLDVPPFGVPL